jgi:hypothetical protein
MRQLTDLRRRLEAAEGALTDALAAMKHAEADFDAADDRFTAAERALDRVREDRAQARRDRYAARQAYERAAVTADRLQRRVAELPGRLDRRAELTSTAPRRVWRVVRESARRGVTPQTSRQGAPHSRPEKNLITALSHSCRDRTSVLIVAWECGARPGGTTQSGASTGTSGRPAGCWFRLPAAIARPCGPPTGRAAASVTWRCSARSRGAGRCGMTRRTSHGRRAEQLATNAEAPGRQKGASRGHGRGPAPQEEGTGLPTGPGLCALPGWASRAASRLG